MSGYRPPIVAGVSGGVGTTILALALHGRDAGTDTAQADLLVCRSSVESLDRAARIADLAWPGRYPVLLVTLDGTERRPPARLARLHDRWTAVVPVPHIALWRELADPYREAAGLLGSPRAELPRPVRALAEAIRRAARVVAESGRLSGPPAAPPTDRPAPEPVPTPPGFGLHLPPAGPFTESFPGPSPATGHFPAAGSFPGPMPPGPPPRWAQAVPPAIGTATGSASPGIPDDRDGQAEPPHPSAPAQPDEPSPLRLIHTPVDSTVDSTGRGEPEHRLPELHPVRGIRVLDAGGVAG